MSMSRNVSVTAPVKARNDQCKTTPIDGHCKTKSTSRKSKHCDINQSCGLKDGRKKSGQCHNKCDENKCGNCHQHENVNMNKKKEVTSGGRNDTVTTHYDHIMVIKPSIPSDQTKVTRDMPGTLARAKDQMKKLVSHKPQTMLDLGPSQGQLRCEPNTNVNRTATEGHRVKGNNHTTLCQNFSPKYKHPEQLEAGRKVSSKLNLNMSLTDSKIKTKARKIEHAQRTFSEDISPSTKDETDKHLTQSLSVHNVSEGNITKSGDNWNKKDAPSRAQASTRERKKDKDILDEKSQPDMVIVLAQQDTTLIEKPKQAWNSPVLKSKKSFGSEENVRPTHSNVHNKTCLEQTMVTSIQSAPCSSKGITDQSCYSGVEDRPTTPGSRLSDSYSDPVLDTSGVYFNKFIFEQNGDNASEFEDAVFGSEDNDSSEGDEVSEDDKALSCKETEDNNHVSKTKNQSNAFSSVVASNEKDDFKQETSPYQNKEPTEQTQGVKDKGNRPKTSRFKKIKKNLATLSTLLPFSTKKSRKSTNPKVGVDTTDPPVDKVTSDERQSPECQTVTMRHATTMTRRQRSRNSVLPS